MYLDLRTGKPYEQYVPVTRGEFSNALADIICASIREGKNLATTCQENTISLSQFYAWLSVFPEFKKRYSESRKQRADYHYHKAVDLADGAVGAPKEFIPGIKLAVDTHKWAAEKSDPERFAKPKEEGNTIGSVTINLQTGVLDREAPRDIVVDQFGNFQGFGNDVILTNEERDTLSKETKLSTDRWGEYDGREITGSKKSISDDGTEEEESTGSGST